MRWIDRAEVYHRVTLLLAVALVPAARLVGGRGSGRHLACQWALAARFPAEDLSGLTAPTLAAFEAARTRALWQYGELIGLTSGYRTADTQARLFDEAVRSTGSLDAARRWVLPPAESRHVAGTALDVRPGRNSSGSVNTRVGQVGRGRALRSPGAVDLATVASTNEQATGAFDEDRHSRGHRTGRRDPGSGVDRRRARRRGADAIPAR